MKLIKQLLSAFLGCVVYFAFLNLLFYLFPAAYPYWESKFHIDAKR